MSVCARKVIYKFMQVAIGYKKKGKYLNDLSNKRKACRGMYGGTQTSVDRLDKERTPSLGGSLQLGIEGVEHQTVEGGGIPALADQGDDSVLVRTQNGPLPVLPVCPSSVLLAAPEQVPIAMGAVFHLFGGALCNPVGGEQLFPVPAPLLQVEQPKGVQLRKGEEQPARPKGIAQGIHFPGGAGDAQVVKQARGQVGGKVAPGPALDQHAGQIPQPANKSTAHSITNPPIQIKKSVL